MAGDGNRANYPTVENCRFSGVVNPFHIIALRTQFYAFVRDQHSRKYKDTNKNMYY